MSIKTEKYISRNSEKVRHLQLNQLKKICIKVQLTRHNYARQCTPKCGLFAHHIRTNSLTAPLTVFSVSYNSYQSLK